MAERHLTCSVQRLIGRSTHHDDFIKYQVAQAFCWKAMKPYATILALSVSLPTSAAFIVQAPKAVTLKAGRTIAFSSLEVPGTFQNEGFSSFQQPPGPISQTAGDARNVWNAYWDSLPDVKVQGGALKTWSYPTSELERVFLAVNSEGPPEGNPVNILVELHQGPDNTPQTMDIYSGKGRLRPFKGWIETPGGSSAVFIRNQSPIEFPVFAKVGAEMTDDTGTIAKGLASVSESIFQMSPEVIVQGGAVRTWDLDPTVTHSKIILKTDGRPLNATVELIQGPNATKYVIQIYTEDGMVRPFIMVMETPGAGNTVRIVNTATLEFPLIASVGPASM